MKAAQINKYGGGEVVEINSNTPDPVVAEGKVLVQVYAAGVNPIDWKMREGYVKDRAPLDFPITLGGDFAGVVKEIGAGVSSFKVGDEIYGQAGLLNNGSGSFAEMAVAGIQKVAIRPQTLTYIETASLPLAGVSALQGIAEHIQAAPVKKILIHGGAGGIGAAAIQIAKHLGAYVAATASLQDADYVKSLGADEVIDYMSQRFEDIVHDYDGVFDASGSGTETYGKSFQVVKKGGMVVSMTEQPQEDLAAQYGVTTLRQSTDVTSQRLAKLAELVEQGVLRIDIDKTFSLDEAAEALTYLQKKHSRGKVVLQMR